MIEIPSHLRIPSDPIAEAEAVVQFKGARFTVLTPRLIRMEFNRSVTFEDRASQVFLFRRFEVPSYETRKKDGRLEIETEFLILRYEQSAEGFTPETLSVTLRKSAEKWSYGDSDSQNLMGTARTLDNIDGAIPLGLGLISRSGWSIVDDSMSLVLGEDGWPKSRVQDDENRDLYFFGYGSDYRACMADFYRISGRTPLIPRWSLGNWWSHYWPYRQEEILGLMADFQAMDVPLSVCMVDMDWHLIELEREISGWTGYTWNRELIPDPRALLKGLHDAGLRTALNLHPALGIRPHEEQYEAFAKQIGVDPADAEDIPFDIASKDFALAYLELLHHPLEDQGVDFWWVDWQQGDESTLSGLDPLWMLNHLHFLDLGREGNRQALILSRWGGLGSHRYPVGFSGDTHVTWKSLSFQPYFTATAANVGFGWWSHDIGGHMLGTEDAELFTRWIQFGVFSPIMRIHSTNNPFIDRRPWGFNAEVLRVTRESMQLRHALVPYLYTMARINSEEGQPLMRPIYHDHPDNEAAYYCPRQYFFGDDLLVAPFVTPLDPDTRMSRQVVWLPPGSWFNFFTGERLDGDAFYAVFGKLDDIPLFARAGAIIPLGPMVGWGGLEAPGELDLHIFAGKNGRFNLFEDDGRREENKEKEYCQTTFDLKWDDHNLVFDILITSGEKSCCPANRQYRIHIHGVNVPESIEVMVGNTPVEFEQVYDEKGEKLVLYGLSLMPSDSLSILLRSGQDPLISHRIRTVETSREMLRTFKLESATKWAIDQQLDEILLNPKLLSTFLLPMSESQSRALLETITQSGMEHVKLYDKGEVLLLWNNQENTDIRYHFRAKGDSKTQPKERIETAEKTIPKFDVITLEKPWSGLIDYYGFFHRSITEAD